MKYLFQKFYSFYGILNFLTVSKNPTEKWMIN